MLGGVTEILLGVAPLYLLMLRNVPAESSLPLTLPILVTQMPGVMLLAVISQFETPENGPWLAPVSLAITFVIQMSVFAYLWLLFFARSNRNSMPRSA